MIIFDYQQIAMASLHAHFNITKTKEVDENFIRHMILNSIRMYLGKFPEYKDEVVIAREGRGSWRRDIFPYYKARRREKRQKDLGVDWNFVFETFNKITAEIEENFPYIVLRNDEAEADDVIGTLCREYGSVMGNGKPIMIISSDKDFIQLQRFGNVKQYSPIQKKAVRHHNPQEYQLELVLKGDVSDGVPNVLSDDDTFVSSKRQKPMTAKKLKEITEDIKEGELLYAASWNRNFERNKQLIDLDCIPDRIYSDIVAKYNKYEVKDRSRIFNYFVSNRLNNLMSDIEDF